MQQVAQARKNIRLRGSVLVIVNALMAGSQADYRRCRSQRHQKGGEACEAMQGDWSRLRSHRDPLLQQAHTGDCIIMSINQTINRADQKDEVCMRSVSLWTPHFFRFPSLKTTPSSQDGMIAHFKAVAEVGIPMMLYNIPGRCGGGGMTSGTIAELWKLPMVCSIKEATGSVDFASEIKSVCDIPIFSGLDPF